VIQYEDQGPGAQGPAGRSLELVATVGRMGWVGDGWVPPLSLDACWEHHQRGGRTALLSGGLTPPSVMPIDSPHGSASGGNENSSGAPPPQGPLGQPWGVATARHSEPITAECCTCLPVCQS
jgi:hypothetical protein